MNNAHMTQTINIQGVHRGLSQTLGAVSIHQNKKKIPREHMY